MENNIGAATSLKQKQYIAVADTLHQDACMCVHITLCDFICLPPLGVPSCPNGVQATNVYDSNFCSVSLTWEQPPNSTLVTSTTVTYCPTSSPNYGNSMTCTSPCTITGLHNGTEYQFTVIPINISGSPNGYTGNTANVTTLGEFVVLFHANQSFHIQLN